MNPEIVLQLVETAIELAQSQLPHEDLTATLLDIVQKGADAYHEHTGEPINASMVGIEESI